MLGGYYAVDFQVHSIRSHDGHASIEEYCARAVELGLDAIGFSEHKDFDPEDPFVNYFDYTRYMEEIQAARQKWGQQLQILAGVEIDYQKRFETQIAAFLQEHAFDYVLGSVHYVDGTMIMTPEYNRFRTKYQAYHHYFQAVLDSVQSGLFDVVAHLEYANRRGIAVWGTYSPLEHEDILRQIFRDMHAKGIALEINTAGLRHGLNQTYPCWQTLKLYLEEGGRIFSIGSDAHQPAQLVYAYEEAAKTLLSLGITHISCWERRQRVEKPLCP